MSHGPTGTRGAAVTTSSTTTSVQSWGEVSALCEKGDSVARCSNDAAGDAARATKFGVGSLYDEKSGAVSESDGTAARVASGITTSTLKRETTSRSPRCSTRNWNQNQVCNIEGSPYLSFVSFPPTAIFFSKYDRARGADRHTSAQ